MPRKAYAWTDGSNGRSSGPCGAASYVIANAFTKEILAEQVEKFPHPSGDVRFTNNDMEMAAILLCVQRALSLGVADLKIHSDSEWCVNIITGAYRLKQEKFLSVVEKIRDLGSEFDNVEIVHVRREFNKRADHLCTTATNQKRAAARTPSIVWPQ